MGAQDNDEQENLISNEEDEINETVAVMDGIPRQVSSKAIKGRWRKVSSSSSKGSFKYDPGWGDHAAQTSLEQSTPEDVEVTEEISYWSLYRYSTRCEKCLIALALVIATANGIVPAITNISMGKFTKAMVDKASNMSVCPPPPGSSTSPFMKQVQLFAIVQIAAGCWAFVMGYLFVALINSVAENQIHRIRKLYFERLLRQSIGWFDKNAKRDFSSRLVEDMLKIQDAISDKICVLSAYMSNSVFLIAAAFYYGWELALPLVCVMPFTMVIVAFNSKVSSKMAAKEQASYASAGAVAEEVFTNIKTVQAFNGQEKEIRRYDEKILEAKKTANKKHIMVGLGNGLTWFISYCNFAFGFWYGTEMVLRSRETGDGLYGPDNLLVIFFCILMAGWYIGDCSQYFQAFGEGTGAAKGIFPMLSKESEVDSLSNLGLIPQGRAVGNIEFENVVFSYPTRTSSPILQGFSLQIAQGQTIALVGKSGCGKTTLLALLQRYYDATSGCIKLDGVDIRQYNIQWLRSQFGVVGQEPVLFNGTIAQNITFGLENVASLEIERVAKVAFAHNFITQFPLGYDTPVGERGAQLSGGQKQRIAITRALCRNPPILMLDEATSALDYSSESIVHAALERAREGRTTIIIAHRLSTIKAADVVVALENGQVKESGTHEELMKLKGLYYRLVLSQEDKEEISVVDQDLELLQDEESSSVFPSESSSFVTSAGRSQATRNSRSRLISEGSLDNALNNCDNEIVMVKPETKPKSSTLWRLWRMNFKEWPYLIIVTICAILKGLQLPVYAYIFGRFIQIFASKDDAEIKRQGDLFALLYTVIAALVGIDGFLQFMFTGFCGENFTYRMRKIIFSSMLDQDVSFFDEPENTVGNLTARLSTDATSLRGVTGSRLTALLQASTIVIAAGALSFYLIPKLSAVIILLVPVMVYSSFLEGKVLGTDNVVEKESIEHSCNLAVQALNNIRTVASLCAEKQFIKMYAEALQDSHRINKRRANLRGFVYGLASSSGYICYALSMLYGGYLVENDCVSIGDVFTVAEALIFCTTSGGAAMSFAPDYDKSKIAAMRIFKLLDRVPLIRRGDSTALHLDNVQGKADMKGVSFRYKLRPNVKVLNNISLSCPWGQHIALVGKSGSGKSTTAQLILRFFDPDCGQVLLDDVDIKKINLDFLRQQMAVVAQEPCLFDYSISQNIAYGDTSRDVPMEEIIEAAKKSNIHEFITSLPAGYQTRVGSLGNQLSGGQKQKVVLARTWIRSPKLLILDEATSALDAESEKAVQDALDEGILNSSQARTSITIAHRLSSIQHCDKILVMKNGSVREMGTHSELMRKENGLYREMWMAQSIQRNA